MEFSFNVNSLFRDEITTVDSNLQPCKRAGIDRHGFRQLQNMLYEVVDRMGDASAKAQGLNGSITSGKKLELAGHRHYIMKDAEGNGSRGTVVGILKVGTKKLFVYDNSKAQHELEPLCVLDFYVHESRQRMGCGKKLFDFMLRCEGVPPQHLAIDRPSPKFTSFLKKHYKLYSTIPQVNNFVIFDGFFNNRSDFGSNRNRRRGYGDSYTTYSPVANQTRAAPAYEQKPPPAPSPQNRTVNSVKKPSVVDELNSVNASVQNVHLPTKSPPSRDGSMGAGEMMYSRHGPSPPNMSHQRSSATPASSQNGTRGRQSPATNSGQMYKQMNGLSSPHMYYNTGMNPGNFYSAPQHPPPSYTQQRSASYGENFQATPQRGPSSTPNFGNRSGLSIQAYNDNSRNQPIPDPRFPPGVAMNPQHLPDITSHQQSNNAHVAHRPPSGKNSSGNKNDSYNPPVLQREGPPPDYREMMNLHQNYQGRAGHLAVPSRAPVISNEYLAPKLDPNANSATTWTVTGVLREQRLNNRYNPTRLW